MQEAADCFKYFVPLETRNEIESVAECLWDKDKAIPWENLRHEVEPWVVDPRNTAGRVTSYDRLIILYWVNMNLIMHCLLSAVAKWKGDEEPMRVWKDHNFDC